MATDEIADGSKKPRGRPRKPVDTAVVIADWPKKPKGRPPKQLSILISSDEADSPTGRTAPASSPTNSFTGLDDDLTISTANSSDSTATPDKQSGDNAATTKTRGRRKLYTTEEQYKESKRINARNSYQKNAEKMKAARQVYKEAHREELKEKAREKYQKDKLERADELRAKAKEKYEKKKDEGKAERLVKRIQSANLNEAAKTKILAALTNAEIK